MNSLFPRLRKTLAPLVWLVVLGLATAAVAAEKAEQIDALMRKYYEYGQFNGTVLVAENGKVLYKKSFGSANMEWNIPNRPDTKFRIGSLTKQFTAMLVLQLVEEGKLRLDGTVADYLPYFRQEVGDQVALHHLLTHTSGISAKTTYTGPKDIRRDPYRPKEFIEQHLTGELEFEPGSKYSYSNLGYFVLGAILEEVTGKSYEALVEERIFDPLGMKNSGYDHHDTILPNRAAGYTKSLGGTRNAPYIDTSLPFAAGALYSTVEDLYLWDQALYSDKLLSPPFLEKYFTPFLNNYAYGWGVVKQPLGSEIGERTFMVHGGTISGFNARITRIVEDRNLFVLLNNTGSARLSEISRGIIRILYGFPTKPPKRSIAEALLKTFREEGMETAAEQYRSLKSAQADTYDFRVNELDGLGRFLLEQKMTGEALAIFQLNAKAYPKDYRVYDSLGDAYMAEGKVELAIRNFTKSLELNPKNPHAEEMLNKLRRR